MRLQKEVSVHEIAAAESELEEWRGSIISEEQRLLNKTKNASTIFAETITSRNLPPPRGSKSSTITTTQPKRAEKALRASNAEEVNIANKKKERISGYDFRAWERYDPDAVIAEMENQENKNIKVIEQSKHEGLAMRELMKERREMRYKKEVDNLRDLLSTNTLTDVQKEHRAGNLLIIFIYFLKSF